MGAPGGLHSPARLVAVALAVIRVAVGWAVVATVVVHRGFRFALSLDFQPVAIGGFRFRVRPATEAVTDGATGVAILIDGGDTEAGPFFLDRQTGQRSKDIGKPQNVTSGDNVIIGRTSVAVKGMYCATAKTTHVPGCFR
jgi:hypothetical protein